VIGGAIFWVLTIGCSAVYYHVNPGPSNWAASAQPLQTSNPSLSVAFRNQCFRSAPRRRPPIKRRSGATRRPLGIGDNILRRIIWEASRDSGAFPAN
jgi:hypothetical protein